MARTSSRAPATFLAATFLDRGLPMPVTPLPRAKRISVLSESSSSPTPSSAPAVPDDTSAPQPATAPASPPAQLPALELLAASSFC
eukprot:scaffold9655_cov123-Isochrysis_galbana.AAC.3